MEPFHDETILYCEQLEKEGIPVHLKEFEGCFLAFDIAGYPTKPAKEAREFLKETFKYAQENYYKVFYVREVAVHIFAKLLLH